MANPFTRLFSRSERKADPALATYATRVQLTGNDQPVYAPRNYQTFARDAYARNVTAHKCIEGIASTVAGIPWHLYSVRGKHRTEIDDHPLLDRLKAPNGKQSQTGLIREFVTYYKLDGNAYLYANRLKRSPEPRELWVLRPDRVKVIPSTNGVVGYTYNVNGFKQTFAGLDVLHWKSLNPLDDLYGLAETEVVGRMVDQQNAGDDRNTALLQNAARPSGGLFAKQVLSDPEFERLNTQMIDEYSGVRNAGMPMLIDGDMKWQPMGMTPLELDWQGARGTQCREICIGFGYPSVLLGDTDAKTYANYETAMVALYTETALPLTDDLRDELNRWYVPMFGDNLLLDYDRKDIEALQENRDGVSARSINEWSSGLLTMNETRTAIGQDEDPNGDIYMFKSATAITLIPKARLGEYANAMAEQVITAAKVATDALLNPPPPPPQLLPPSTEPPALPPGKKQPATTVTPVPDASVAAVKAMSEVVQMVLSQRRVTEHKSETMTTQIVASEYTDHFARWEER